MLKTFDNEAAAMVEAIKTLASKPENLDNLEAYLSLHFQTWLDRWANTPEGISAEMQAFANMTI